MSETQPGVVFTINDSGHDALLFALDTTGIGRGVWRVTGATNVDWEAASLGPCAMSDSVPRGGRPYECLYIGDVGDNDERRLSRTIYRVREPRADGSATDSVAAEHLHFRYIDGPHDVEAMYVAPTGALFLITKRRRAGASGHPRPALVFSLPPTAWDADTLAVAQLSDSLPIIPGSASGRTITDASLSPDGRHLAVRTYREVFVFATDSGSGRVRTEVRPAICDISRVERGYGEGITWLGLSSFLLTQEGRRAPMHVIRCSMPNGTGPRVAA
ncbi:MAG: hypothetical protein ACT4P7_09630 [Gemmatimonadaceae bacterium]